MKKPFVSRWVLAVAVALFATSTPVFASVSWISATISLNQVYTGATPDGTPPWLVATFTQTGPTTGTLTLTSDLSASDFLQGLNSPHATDNVGWAFYLNQSLSSVTCETGGTCGNGNSGFNASGFNTGPVGGVFNLAFGWGPGASNRFVAGSAATYDLTFSSDLTGNPFVGNTDGWLSVAHVQGITGGCSGWIVAGTGSLGTGSGPCTITPPPHSVPEPSDLGIFGLGVLLIGGFLGWRRRQS